MRTTKEIFGENIRALLIRESMLPNHLAKRLGVAAATVKKWVDGTAIPEFSYLDAMRDAFNWTLDDLFHEIPVNQRDLSAGEVAAYINKHPEKFTTVIKVKRAAK